MIANLNPENFKQSSRKTLKNSSVSNVEERTKISGKILCTMFVNAWMHKTNNDIMRGKT